jgi:hypothetical protein
LRRRIPGSRELVTDISLDNAILKEAAKGDF